MLFSCRNRFGTRCWTGRLLSLFAVSALFLLASVCAVAQSTTDGAIGGTIYDANGAVIPNAAVTVHNNGTDAEQRATADASGYYRVTGLQPAEYTVTVSAPGFAQYKAQQVIVQVGSLTSVSPKLAVGGTAETVSVTGEAPQINTVSADFAPTLNSVAIDQLPINGGRWSDFALLTPGVVNNSSGFGLLSFRGISTLLNNNTVDGADNNQAFFSEERGRTRAGYSTPRVAIQEFQVNTSNYSSEYGRSAGGVINTVTKSGTNQFHGETYFYDRDNDWGSTNPFTTLTTQSSPGVITTSPYKPKDWRKMWGAGIGGPVIKDRLFFYFAYDQYRRNFPGTAVPGSVPVFFATPTASTISTLASRLGVSTAQAQATYNTDLNGLISMLGPVARKGDQTIFLPKVDWTVNQKNHASFEVNRMRWNSPAGIQTQSSNTYGIASFGNDYVKDTWAVAKLDTEVTNRIANELRYQYGRDFEYEFSQTPTPYEQSTLNNNATFGYTNPLGSIPPQVNISNGFTFGTPTFLERPAYPDERRQQIADSVTMSRGNHTLKFGVDYSHIADVSKNLFEQYGSFSYSSLLNYFSDLNKADTCGTKAAPAPCYTSFGQGFGPQGFEFHTNDLAFFAQDDWKLFPRLTVNLGVRYENELLPSPFSSLVNPQIPQTAHLASDNNNFGPRVGFAFDVFGDAKTVVRGGYGIYYGRIINGTVFNGLTATDMPGAQVTYSYSASAAGAPAFPNVLAAQPTGVIKANVAYFDPHFQNPQIHETDLTIEHDFGWNTVASISYLGSYGRELPDFVDTNIAPATKTITYAVTGGPLNAQSLTEPLYTARINPNFGQMIDIFSGVNSNYQALALQLNHRMSHYVQFSANYTWSHALDYGQNENTTGTGDQLLDPYNLRAEYGNSSYNVPNRFVLAIVGQSPWRVNGWLGYLANGWEMAPMFQAQTGLPYTMTTSGTAPGAFPGGGGINGSNGVFRIPQVGRNTFRYPGTQVVDLRISKHFKFHDRYDFEVLGEGFNLLNHENITGVTTLGYFVNSNSTLTYNSAFGVPNAANSNFAYSTRQVQLAARLHF